MNDDIFKVLDELVPQIKSSEIIISHQITSSMKPLTNLPGNIKYFYMFEKGLSKNRNNALKHATGDICFICDDDLRFVKNFEKKILNLYENNLNADVISFRTILPNGDLRKNYSSIKFKHNYYSILKITSHEISFKRKSLIKSDILFNETFGLGSLKYPAGEENLFMFDCLKNKLNVIYEPVSIDIHPEYSSGYNYDLPRVRSNVAIFRKMFGSFISFLLIFYFSIKHYNLYKHKFSYLKFMKISFKELF